MLLLKTIDSEIVVTFVKICARVPAIARDSGAQSRGGWPVINRSATESLMRRFAATQRRRVLAT
jgi:hypothetical protein